MALRTNRLNAQSYMPGIFAGGTEAWNVKRIDLLKNIYADQGNSIDNKSGVPNGYNMEALLLPLKPGGMSVYEPNLLNLAKANADAKMGRNLVGSATLTIVVTNAQADQIISMTASGTTAIAVGTASLSAGVQAVASGTLSITGDLSLGGIIPITASSTMSASTNVTMTALAFIEAAAGGPTPLSPEGLAQAVWNSTAANYVDPGTMGEKLNDAGAGANPWSADLASNNTPGTFGNFVQKLLTVSKFLGLK